MARKPRKPKDQGGMVRVVIFIKPETHETYKALAKDNRVPLQTYLRFLTEANVNTPLRITAERAG